MNSNWISRVGANFGTGKYWPNPQTGDESQDSKASLCEFSNFRPSPTPPRSPTLWSSAPCLQTQWMRPRSIGFHRTLSITSSQLFHSVRSLSVDLSANSSTKPWPRRPSWNLSPPNHLSTWSPSVHLTIIITTTTTTTTVTCRLITPSTCLTPAPISGSDSPLVSFPFARRRRWRRRSDSSIFGPIRSTRSSPTSRS